MVFKWYNLTMKKYLYLTSCIALGIVMQIICFLIFAIIFDAIDGFKDGYEGSFYVFLMLLIITYPICKLFSIMTRLYDGKSKEDKKTISDWRFVMIASMIGLGLLVILVAILVTEKSTGKEGLIAFLTIIITVASSTIFALRYNQLLPKETRINKLIKKSSFSFDHRGTLLVDEVVNEMSVKGKVAGTLFKGDTLMHIGPPNYMTRIVNIYVDNQQVNKVENGYAEIIIRQNPNLNPTKFSVFTNYETRFSQEDRNNTENPALRAMIDGYNEYHEIDNYMSILVYDICHAHYLIPAIIPKEDVKGDITETYKGSTTFQLFSVANDERPDEHVFPIFTDWEALRNYKEVIEHESTISLVITFPDVIRIIRENKYDGVVINPFGPSHFFMSDEYVLGITELEGYKNDFIYNEK